MQSRRNLATLPVDIIQAVFKECINNELEEEQTWERLRRLSHISRNIRRVARDTPELWTRIHMLLHPAAILTNLALARDAPLLIYISPQIALNAANRVRPKAFLERLQMFMTLVSETSRRWESLSFEITSVASGEWFFAFGDGLDLSALGHIYIDMDYEMANRSDLFTASLYWDVPALVTLDLFDVWPGCRTISSSFLQTVRLSKYVWSPDSVVPNMDFASLLLKSLNTLGLPSGDPDTDNTVHLECLKEAKDPLIFPQLHDLRTSLLQDDGDHPYNIKDWRNFSQCRFPVLKTLQIDIRKQPLLKLTPLLLRALGDMPVLEQLRLMFFEEVLMEALINKTVFQGLKLLYIYSCLFRSDIMGNILSWWTHGHGFCRGSRLREYMLLPFGRPDGARDG